MLRRFLRHAGRSGRLAARFAFHTARLLAADRTSGVVRTGKPGLAACGDQALSRGLGLRGWGVSSTIGPVFPARADVIVALGGGIASDGEPLPATVARARRAAVLYSSGRAHRIVMSGAHGMFDPPPLRAEAVAMAQIAVAAGVPGDAIVIEARSRDTIGNIWFTKPLLAEHRWYRVLVVTSGWHAPRVRYLAQTTWGPSYLVAIDPVTDEKSTRTREEIALWEAGLLAVSRRWFATIRPGDDAATAAVLAREHPIYASHPQATPAELAQMVTRRPPDHRWARPCHAGNALPD